MSDVLITTRDEALRRLMLRIAQTTGFSIAEVEAAFAPLLRTTHEATLAADELSAVMVDLPVAAADNRRRGRHDRPSWWIRR